jgi:hypothetical protein
MDFLILVVNIHSYRVALMMKQNIIYPLPQSQLSACSRFKTACSRNIVHTQTFTWAFCQQILKFPKALDRFDSGATLLRHHRRSYIWKIIASSRGQERRWRIQIACCFQERSESCENMRQTRAEKLEALGFGLSQDQTQTKHHPFSSRL